MIFFGNLFLDQLGELLFQFQRDFLFLLFLSVFIFTHQRVIPVFNHVFCSGFMKQRNYFAPFLAVLVHVFEYCQVFFEGPVSMVLFIVQMVQPSFPAMFWGSKYFLLRGEKHSLGNLIPFSGFLKSKQLQKVLDGVDEESVFLRSPCDSLFVFQQI